MFHRLPLMAKVALAPIAVMLCLLLVTAVQVVNTSATTVTLERVTQGRMVNMARLGELRQQLLVVNGDVLRSIANSGAGVKQEVVEAFDQKLRKALQGMLKELGDVRAHFKSDPAADKQLEQMQAIYKKYITAVEGGIDMKDADLPSAMSFLTTSENAFAELQKVLGQLQASEARLAAEQGEQASGSLLKSQRAAMGLCALALLVGMGVTWFSVRRIVTPLRDAMGVAQQIAAGDLVVTAASDASDETGRVLQALDSVSGSLRAMITDIRRAAEQIDTASAEIAVGNHDLSSRTERTAAFLQQTASSVQQLTQTVQVNAESAQQANQLATEATQVARRGGAAVTEVVDVMARIHQQATKISEITAVIDGIAFQTNILALNAAVEAARAGEQGRGFAVVATEVRQLAKRSADAAKEIKGLIGATVEQVGAGVDRVKDAGETMKEVVSSIDRVGHVIEEISRASTDQASGIAEVNRAVSEMDKTTQQNAALVEEAAAATSSLKQQAHGLVQAVAAFKVA